VKGLKGFQNCRDTGEFRDKKVNENWNGGVRLKQVKCLQSSTKGTKGLMDAKFSPRFFRKQLDTKAPGDWRSPQPDGVANTLTIAKYLEGYSPLQLCADDELSNKITNTFMTCSRLRFLTSLAHQSDLPHSVSL
jgi:hypothetical protein